MPAQHPQPHEIHFARNVNTNDVWLYATKYLPDTGSGSKMAIWRTNSGLELIPDSRRVVSYNCLHGNRHEDHLQEILGPNFKVLDFYAVYRHLKTL